MIDVEEVHTSPATPSRWARVGSIAATSVVAALTLSFAVAHIERWRRTGEPTGLAFAVQEIFLVVFFITRRRPQEVNRRIADWVPAVIGAYGALLLRPEGHAVLGLSGLWLGIQVVAAVGALACIMRLGRSFGIVAANRGVCATGPYRFVRHPMYACYLFGQIAYVLGAMSVYNVVILCFAVGGQLVRIAAEERVLRRDQSYCAYAQTVRHRLIPGLY